MADAREYGHELRGILHNAIDALEHGQIASDSVAEAAQLLKLVSDKLTIAYYQALAHVNKLDDLLVHLKLVLMDSQSLKVMQALGNFEVAREQMDQARMHIKLQQEKVDALRTVLELGTVTQNVRESKVAFLNAVELLRDYIRGVE